MKVVFIEDIDLDSSPMVRAELRQDVVDEYADIHKANKKQLPPVVLFTADGKISIVADGMHRIAAMKKLGQKTIIADVRKGTYENALAHALLANERHGLRRSQADKRICIQQAVKMWPKFSNNMIAQHCAVDNHTVKDVRDDMEEAGSVKSEPVRDTSDGRKTKATRTEPAEKKPSGPVKLTEADNVGRVLTAHALPFWNRTDEVKQLLSSLSDVSRMLRAAQRDEDLMYGEVNFSAALGDLDKVMSNLSTAVPYAICTQCQGQPKDCRLCKGKGLISKFRWDTCVPAEVKKLAKKK